MLQKDKAYQIFETWLNACMHGPIGDHFLQEMACAPQVSIPDEQVQLSWFDTANWDAVRAYHGRWYKSASLRLINEAPEDVVKLYCLYCTPLDEEKQVALIKRDIACSTHLAEEYFGYYHACQAARQLIHNQAQTGDEYFVHLWHRVLKVYYGWGWEFEQKFGTLAKWQQKLKSHFDELTVCSFDDIEKILHAIE